MSDNNKTNPVKEMLEGAYYYENTSVGRTRKDKTCDICSSTIPTGSSHNGATIFNSEFTNVIFCEACEMKYSTELAEMENGEYDDF